MKFEIKKQDFMKNDNEFSELLNKALLEYRNVFFNYRDKQFIELLKQYKIEHLAQSPKKFNKWLKEKQYKMRDFCMWNNFNAFG